MQEKCDEEREPVVYENEGQKIFGVLHRPKGIEKAPAIVICHGFAGNKIGRYRIYISLAQRLARLGIAVLRFDFRGSGDSEGDFSEMTLESEVSDALRSVAFLRDQDNIDPTRVGILGNSFGSAVSILAAEQDREIASLCVLAPLFDSTPWKQKWALLKTDPEGIAQKEMNRILEGNRPGPNFFRTFFEMNLETSLRAVQEKPMLVIYSEKDERVGIEQVEHYKKIRSTSLAESEWLALPNSDHDFSNPEERKLLVEKAARWFVKTLK